LSESSTLYLLSSPHVTEADVRLFTTIIHFVIFFKDIRQRPNGSNLKLVNLAMALSVVILDVFKVTRLFESGVVLFQSY